eukprot:gene8448-5926_t
MSPSSNTGRGLRLTQRTAALKLCLFFPLVMAVDRQYCLKLECWKTRLSFNSFCSSKRIKPKGRRQSGHEDDGSAAAAEVGVTTHLPRCVSLLQSASYADLAEACGDLTFYATQAKQHGALLGAGVPQRLAELLAPPPLDPSSAAADPLPRRLHQGIVNMQVSAAEALINCITNSSCDEAVDALASHQGFADTAGQPVAYGSLLLGKILQTWSLVAEARRFVPQDEAGLASFYGGSAADDDDDDNEDADGRSASSSRRTIRLYFTLLHLHEQLLRLADVSADGCEAVAAAFSTPPAAAALLQQLEDTTTTAWTAVQREPLCTGDASSAFLQQEAGLHAHVAAAVADALQTLSADNPGLAACFTCLVPEGAESSGVTPRQKGWLDQLVNGSSHLEWLQAQPTELAVPHEGGHRLELERLCVVHQLLHSTLAVQAMLVNLFPSAENVRRVLPLTVQVLSTFKPIRQWRHALPFLQASCGLEEEARAGIVRLTTGRLRCAKTAIEVLNSCVAFICEGNADGVEDEVGFGKNPLAAVLFETNALHVFGSVLKDALWLSEEDPAGDLNVLRSGEQRALRLAAQSNSEVTTMQFVILSTEVGVWNLASSLLLMVAAESLGETPAIWRAMISAVQNRSELLRLAYLADAAHAAAPQPSSTPEALVHSVATESPAARHLLWLQIKALVQILWTLGRKQSNSQGTYFAANFLGAVPADVDLLTRLAWEKECPPAVTQACVAAVGFICCSFQTSEAAAVAARFASAILQNAGGAVPLSDLEGGVLRTGMPTTPKERQTWLARLQRADTWVDTRCEAANTLIDMFSDERYDTDVYLPLNQQRVLINFHQQLRPHLGARQRVAKELWKNYRVEAPPIRIDWWAEVDENLEGFISYKKQNTRASKRINQILKGPRG